MLRVMLRGTLSSSSLISGQQQRMLEAEADEFNLELSAVFGSEALEGGRGGEAGQGAVAFPRGGGGGGVADGGLEREADAAPAVLQRPGAGAHPAVHIHLGGLSDSAIAVLCDKGLTIRLVLAPPSPSSR